MTTDATVREPIGYVEPVYRPPSEAKSLIRARLLDRLDHAIANPDRAPLRPEWARGL